MRQVATFLLIALALPASAAETWRWKDASGVVHYSDRPVPGAERIKVGPAGSDSSTAATASPVTAPPPAQPITEFRYSGCVVVAPANDEVFNAVRTVNASLQITPAVQPGHRLQVMLDGMVYTSWPERALSAMLVDIYRGSHTLAVQVLDANGRSLCAGPTITFHVRQPSILSPARQPAAPKP